MIKKFLTVAVALFMMSVTAAAAPDRWNIGEDGAINWKINEGDAAHSDHLEMSGQQISVVLRYGVDDSGAFSLNRSLVFPMLRMKPNKTQNNLKQRFDVNIPGLITIDDLNMTDEKVSSVKFDGIMTVESSFSHVHRRKKVDNAVSLRRVLYPAVNGAYYCEEYTFTNNMKNPITLRVPEWSMRYTTPEEAGVYGGYTIEAAPSATRLDAIFHLASPAFPAAYHSAPLEPVMCNIDATRHLLELASAHHARFIFSSSCEIYGESAKILAETDMGYLDCMDWRSCYNESKRVGETLTQSFAHKKGIQSVILRIPRTFGATFGAHDDRALSSFLRDCASDRDIVLKSDGQQMYSFLYVGDCARSLAFALAKLPTNNAYNIASEAMSLKDFALRVAGLNPKVRLRIDKTEQAGITKTQYSILDTSKIESYGFFPKFSLQEGLEWTFRILQENKERE